MSRRLRLTAFALLAFTALAFWWFGREHFKTVVYLRCPDAAAGVIEATWEGGEASAPLAEACGPDGLPLPGYPTLEPIAVDLHLVTPSGEARLQLAPFTHLGASGSERAALVQVVLKPVPALAHDSI